MINTANCISFQVPEVLRELVKKVNAEKTSQIKPLEQEMAINQLEQQEIK